MRAKRSNANSITFHLGKREADLFEKTLCEYPVLNPAQIRISRGGGVSDQENSEELLREALAEQQEANRLQILQLLEDRARYHRSDRGVQLVLTPGETEWLLQVLNDIRVGSWMALGCPEHKPSRLALSAGLLTLGNARHYWSMEVAGYFQMNLLEALHPDS